MMNTMNMFPFFIECSKHYQDEPHKQKFLQKIAFGHGIHNQTTPQTSQKRNIRTEVNILDESAPRTFKTEAVNTKDDIVTQTPQRVQIHSQG